MSKDSKARNQKGKILSFFPTGEYYFKKGLKAYHRRDFRNAKKYLQRAVQLEPYEPMLLFQLAIICTDLGEYKQSNELLHKILEELDDEMVECHYFLANNYAHLGFFKDAYHHANVYLDLDEDGEFAEDTEDLLELLMLEADELDENPYEEDDLIFQQEQARELLEAGHFPEAIKILTSVIEQYPEYWSAYNNLALAYFYLGEADKAGQLLDDVLERNSGNLHALCNKLIFAHYSQRTDEVERLTKTLKIIKPILIEHQYKLGATFALVGEYGLAYGWLRKLQKLGFEGDGAFFYWLSYSAYHTGREEIAKNVWKRVLELTPEKEGNEPWNHSDENINSFEKQQQFIMSRMVSEHIEERLFALFLTSISNKKNDILASVNLNKNNQFSGLEKDYLSLINSENTCINVSINAAHETAKLLYNTHHPIGATESGLFLLWFSVYVEIVQSGLPLRNNRAWAAAIEYTWHKFRSEKISQQKLAEQYGVSTATIGKYVKKVNSYLK